LGFWRDYVSAFVALIPNGIIVIERTTTWFNPAARRRCAFVGYFNDFVYLIECITVTAETTLRFPS
jgi:hypothetical protein